MKVKNAIFLISNTDYEKCPAPAHPEYAFIGRSNVGKSSLINMLTNNAHLAKVSGTPGKTQTINHFLINGNWFLTDLPGYGWASLPQKMRIQFKEMINGYLLNRRNLRRVFVLIDIRLEPQKIDLDFMNWLATGKVPFTMVFTKADKLSKTKAGQMIEAYHKKMLEKSYEIPKYFITSSANGTGQSDLLNYIHEINSEPSVWK